MASQQHKHDSPPPYSHHPSPDKQVLAIAPESPLATATIQIIQETFPGVSTENTWELIQNLTQLV